MRKIILIMTLLLLLTGCRRADSDIVVLGDEFSSSSEISMENEEEEMPVTEASEEILLGVYVCGAVISPGVYYLEDGSRLIDVVNAAGGFSEDADETFVNLAAPVQDGIKLQIPTIQETSALLSSAEISSFGGDIQQPKDGGGRININNATKEELKTLPGIGDGIAGKIIDYRTKNGTFSSVEDIMKISGIKEKLFEKIKDSITV